MKPSDGEVEGMENRAMRQIDSTTPRVSFLDVLNAVGSLASITGISLLYVKGEGQLNFGDMIGIGLIASSSLGLAAFILWLFLQGYRRYVTSKSLLLRIAYFGVGVPAALVVAVLVALIVNKVFISIEWSWFVHR